MPTLDKRGRKIVTRMADIIGYARPIQEEDGTTKTMLFMRGTPRFVAGSRFPDTPDVIEFNYKNLVDAIHEAVEALEKRFGADAITDDKNTLYAHSEPTASIEDLIKEFDSTVEPLMDSDPIFFGPRIKSIVDKIMGQDNKVSNATPDQAELVDLVIEEVKALKK